MNLVSIPANACESFDGIRMRIHPKLIPAYHTRSYPSYLPRANFSPSNVMYSHTIWCRATIFGVITHVADGKISRVNHTPTQGGSAPGKQFLFVSVFTHTLFDIELPNYGAINHLGEGKVYWGWLEPKVCSLTSLTVCSQMSFWFR